MAGSRRGRWASVLAASVVLTGASCVGLLDLDDYAGAAQSLCDLLATCYGADAYADCHHRLSQALDGADPALRTQWLTSFGEQNCLKNCTTAKRCLDALPICQGAGSGCAQREHCCGFTKGEGKCGTEQDEVTGQCCLLDGLPCTHDGACCTAECSTATGTCGGQFCKGQGEACDSDDDCCSKNCAAGRCVLECLPDGEACTDDDDCCRDTCVDNVCTCRDVGDPCTTVEQCCSGACGPGGLCEDSSNCSPLLEPCVSPTDCCQGLTCEDDDLPGLCCVPDGASCSDPASCCGGDCVQGACCSLPGMFCEGNADCCYGSCDPGSNTCGCTQATGACGYHSDCCDDEGGVPLVCHEGTCQLCKTTTCHHPCATGGPLATASNPDVVNCNGAAGQQPCVDAICSQEESAYCCCIVWNAACVAAAYLDASQDGPCAGLCYIDPN
jgi:hypothetical protein